MEVTALHLAIIAGNTSVVRVLLDSAMRLDDQEQMQQSRRSLGGGNNKEKRRLTKLCKDPIRLEFDGDPKKYQKSDQARILLQQLYVYTLPGLKRNS